MVRVLDGGLATSLQALGLPRHSPVEPWVLDHPERVERVQRAFEAAGAEILLTPTFRSLPSESAHWRRSIEAGVALTRRARTRAEIWLSLGPGDGHGHAVAAAEGVDGVVLETFVHPEEARQALEQVLPCSVPVVVSLVPPRSVAGLREIAASFVDAGAAGVGFNCGSGAAVQQALAALPPRIRGWAKPNGVDTSIETWARLAERAYWLGGCCGTTPEMIEALSARWGR